MQLPLQGGYWGIGSERQRGKARGAPRRHRRRKRRREESTGASLRGRRVGGGRNARTGIGAIHQAGEKMTSPTSACDLETCLSRPWNHLLLAMGQGWAAATEAGSQQCFGSLMGKCNVKLPRRIKAAHLPWQAYRFGVQQLAILAPQSCFACTHKHFVDSKGSSRGDGHVSRRTQSRGHHLPAAVLPLSRG